MDNKLNVQKLGYEVGEPMWVHWDDRYVWRGVNTIVRMQIRSSVG